MIYHLCQFNVAVCSEVGSHTTITSSIVFSHSYVVVVVLVGWLVVSVTSYDGLL